MLTITSYIGKKTMDSFECSKAISRADFLPLKHDSLTIEMANNQMKKCNDRWFIGAVVIRTTDTELTSFIDWDDIDFIWLGILEMLLAYQKDGYGEHYTAYNSHTWSIKKINTNPANLIKFRLSRNPLIFTGGRFSEVDQEITSIIYEKEFLSKILKAAHEYMTFREQLFDIGSVPALKAIMSDIYEQKAKM